MSEMHLSPHDFVFRRARQIQEEILPAIAEARADLDRQELILRTEMTVLGAASEALPPERLPLSAIAQDIEDAAAEGGAE